MVFLNPEVPPESLRTGTPPRFRLRLCDPCFCGGVVERRA